MLKILRNLIRVVGYEIYRTGMPYYGVNAMADIKRYSHRKITTLVDVGANIGQTSREFSHYFSDASIHAFEPVSGTFEALVANTRDLRNVTSHRLAVGSSPGTSTIWLQANNQTNSLNSALNVQTGRSETVSVTTLDAFTALHGIREVDVLKTDTENFDLEVMEGAASLLREGRVSFVLSEVGIAKSDTGHTNLFELSERLLKDNFDLMGIYDRLYHEKCPRVRSWCNALFIRRDLLDWHRSQ
jgi:FkbM family methyltransferase